ncbi:MAG: VanZ family protein [Saprospiraceae bacterium]
MLPNTRKWALVLAIFVTLVVVYLSLGNPPQIGPKLFDFEGADKIKHALAYATLAVLWLNAFTVGTPTGSKKGRYLWLWLWGALFLLGVLLEVLQWTLFPNRYFEYADMLANGIGAGIGSLIFKRILPS